jgi:hypothetical protein
MTMQQDWLAVCYAILATLKRPHWMTKDGWIKRVHTSMEGSIIPLPRPLKRGASKARKKKVVTETMHDLKHGPHHKERTRKQEIAIAMKQSGQSRKSRKKK